MIFDILVAVIGLILALFLPGFLLSKILFPKIDILETIAFSIAFSIAIDIILGLFLGINETMKDLTGGITAENLWFYTLVIVFLLLGILLIQRYDLFRK